jgi:hypothetical protein
MGCSIGGRHRSSIRMLNERARKLAKFVGALCDDPGSDLAHVVTLGGAARQSITELNV